MLLLITWKTRSFWRSRSNCSFLILTSWTLWSVVRSRRGEPVDLFLNSCNSLYFLFLCIIFKRFHEFKYSCVFSRSVSSTMPLILLWVLSLNCLQTLYFSILISFSFFYQVSRWPQAAQSQAISSPNSQQMGNVRVAQASKGRRRNFRSVRRPDDTKRNAFRISLNCIKLCKGSFEEAFKWGYVLLLFHIYNM